MTSHAELSGPYAPGTFERSLDQRPGHRPAPESTPTPRRVAASAPNLARCAFTAGAMYGGSQDVAEGAGEAMRRALQASMDTRQ